MKAKYTSQLLLSWLLIAFTATAATTNASAQSAGGQVLQSPSSIDRKTVQKSITLEQYQPREPSIRFPRRFELRGGSGPPLRTHFDKGEAEYQAGRNAAAVPELKEAVKESPSSYESHYLLALTLTETGKLREAVEEFKKAIELATDTEKIVANYNMANVYFDLAEYADAAAAYRQAIKLDDTLSKPHYNLGLAYVGLNRLADAADAFKHATELKAEYAEAQYNLGVAYLQLQRKSDAENQITILTRLKPELANKLAVLIQGHGL